MWESKKGQRLRPWRGGGNSDRKSPGARDDRVRKRKSESVERRNWLGGLGEVGAVEKRGKKG